MAQANIYWLQENYAAVEKIFRKSVEFCNDNEIWKLNVRKFGEFYSFQIEIFRLLMFFLCKIINTEKRVSIVSIFIRILDEIMLNFSWILRSHCQET
jgi:hypothetical protein